MLLKQLIHTNKASLILSLKRQVTVTAAYSKLPVYPMLLYQYMSLHFKWSINNI